MRVWITRQIRTRSASTAISARRHMVSELKGGDTLLTGLLDRSALYGVLAEIEALGLSLIEVRRLTPK
jgi:hypothetical protein